MSWIVDLAGERAEPSRDVVGGKAWSVWRMTSLGLRVPPAFVVTTDACRAYFADGERLADGLRAEIEAGVRQIEQSLGRTFGGGPRPLLLSVRSGAAVSMPGMMDTVLNLGIDDGVEALLADEFGDERFARDTHERFLASYGEVVLGALDELPDGAGVAEIRAAHRRELDAEVPADPSEQLLGAVAAVFRSSRSRRAIAYRRHYGLPDDLGTAVTIQAMVFGNLDERSGTGVLFSRNPLDGADVPYGEFLPRAQGEDVVSGRVTPQPLEALATSAPDVHAELLRAAALLERSGRDAQDIEFTVQAGELFLLQARSAKRTGEAAVRIAAAMLRDGTIDADEALARVTPAQAVAAMRRRLAPAVVQAATPLASGLGACPGVAVGVATGGDAVTSGGILVRRVTAPDDVPAMLDSVGIVTERGGATSHAAVVSRALDLPCVVGCGEGTIAALDGQTVTIDGDSGTIYAGALAVEQPDERDDPDLALLIGLAEERAGVRVLAADDDDEAVARAVNVDDQAETPVEELQRTLAGTPVVAGALFGNEAHVAAAVAAGCTTIVAPRRLPALLAAVRARETGERAATRV